VLRLEWLVLLAAEAASAGTVYHGGVDDIFARRCVVCHQAGGIGPMQLGTYAQVRPWARAIREAVLERTMPPWPADSSVGVRFRNDRSLSAEERQAIVDWVDAGAAEGPPVVETKMVPGGTGPRPEGRRAPDLVVKIPGFAVPASGVVEYTFLVTPVKLGHDEWVERAEWKVQHPEVIHHINAFIRPKGSSYVAEAPAGKFYVASGAERSARRPDEAEIDRRELLVGYEPGYRPEAWGEGRAKLLRKDADIVFEMHYTPNGHAVTDDSELDIYFAREAPRERVITIAPADARLEIPAGDADYHSEATATFTRPVTLISLQPHMHLRGKAYRMTLVYPDGRRQLLLSVPRYDFHWQTTYFLAKPMRLEKGAAIQCVAEYDNSPNNPNNPDPSKTVRWGDQSWEEMNIGFLEAAIPAGGDADVAVLSGTTKPAPGGERLQ
jgi:hypothetical protein